MPSFVTATVTALLSERAGLQRVDTEAGRAYVLTDVVGPVAPGDRVVLNTTAVDLGLGTGGWHVVHWNTARDAWSRRGSGHIMKVRYTSVQVDAGAAEEHHPDLPTSVPGTPVVACSLHSQVAVVAAVAHHLRPAARIAYVMTDGAALPLALSDLVHALRGAGVLATTITAGHAFGGDLEAVAVPSALALAVHVARADLVVVGMGPGVVGTASALGTTAVEVAAVVDVAARLGARVGLCCRASDGDRRARHRGVSHHVRTILDLATVPPEVPLPPAVAGEVEGAVPVDPPDVGAVLDGMGLRVTTMGRGPAEDPLFFGAAGAAGRWAADAVAGGDGTAAVGPTPAGPAHVEK
ncbi:MAG TPA: DUF3866 family protein [Acidimicrobiales bacterium]|nr:DUF3866 family protein [Acidimicrobiales bacterium]